MALITEDGTGLLTAESYVTVAAFKAYHVARGNGVEPSDLDLERHLRLATEYIDLTWGHLVRGFPLTEGQALVFPNTQFTEPLPLYLIRATHEYAWFSINNSLFHDVVETEAGAGGVIKLREKLGPIETETEYADPGIGGAVKPSRPRVGKADRLMRLLMGVSSGGVFR
jgi:hypothetical protein